MYGVLQYSGGVIYHLFLEDDFYYGSDIDEFAEVMNANGIKTVMMIPNKFDLTPYAQLLVNRGFTVSIKRRKIRSCKVET